MKMIMRSNFLNRVRNQNGFSMIENVLAATLLAIGLIGGMTVMQNATASAVNNDLSSIATELASEKIESVLGDKVFNGFDYLDQENYEAETAVGIYNMNRSVVITEVNADDLVTPEADSGIKRINVTVTWGGANSANYQQITLTTLASDF